MKIQRLFEILYILMDKKNVTAEELAEHFEVTPRTIYRDIDLLSQAGIPVYAMRGKKGGIRILDNFVFDKSLISETEQTEIMSALSAVAVLPNIEQTNLIDKLASFFKRNDTSWISVDFSDWNEGQKNIFDNLKESVVWKRTAHIDYINSKGEKSDRIIEPVKLWFKGRAWYVLAYCRKAEDYRLFRLSRIKGITVTDEDFEREIPDIHYDDTVKEGTEVILRISPKMEYRVYDEFTEFERDNDGYFIVRVNFPVDEWLFGYIMSFGEYAEVVSPEWIRSGLKKKIEKVLKNYS